MEWFRAAPPCFYPAYIAFLFVSFMLVVVYKYYSYVPNHCVIIRTSLLESTLSDVWLVRTKRAHPVRLLH